MKQRILALALAVTTALGSLTAAADDPVFSSVPDPASVQLYFEPPQSVAGTMLAVDDPLEGFNRSMYTFNAHFDRVVFLPVVNGYKWVMPDLAERGVSNFFGNLYEIRNISNNLMQGRGKDTLVSTGRLLVNSTLGLGGLFDPATRMGMTVRKEDFGQTLGLWGVPEGAYLVLPLLGPSGLRDAGGLAVDAALASSLDPLDLEDHAGANAALNLLRAVDTRANTAFRYYRTGSPFEYVLVRYAYTRMRQIEIER